MPVADTQPSFVAVNASVLNGPVAVVPAPSFAPPESASDHQSPVAVSKKRNLNDGRKWLAALLLVTAAGGAAAVGLNPALRPSAVAWSSLSTVQQEIPAQSSPQSIEPVATPAATATASSTIEPPVDTPRPSPADDANTLWHSALNAESHRDFATAVILYQRLESLPNTDWPPGLHTRLRLAQQEMVSGLR